MTTLLYQSYAHAHGETPEDRRAHEGTSVKEYLRWLSGQRVEFRKLHGDAEPTWFDAKSTADTVLLTEAGTTAFTAYLSAKFPAVRGGRVSG